VDVNNAFNGLPVMNDLLPPQPQRKQLGHVTPVFGYLPNPPQKKVPIYIVFYVVCLKWKWKV
jgi:hypothetical protein